MNEPVIPWTRLVGFVRQHTHDVRNDLNVFDLEMQFLYEDLGDVEAKESVARIRQQLKSVEKRLHALSSAFHEGSPEALPISAVALLSVWREKHEERSSPLVVSWISHLEAEKVNVDDEMMGRVFSELLDNAEGFSSGEPVTITGQVSGNEVVFELREPKAKPVQPESWIEPLCSTRHGHHGLGLWKARRLSHANGASLQQHYDEIERCLITRIRMQTCG